MLKNGLFYGVKNLMILPLLKLQAITSCAMFWGDVITIKNENPIKAVYVKDVLSRI
jgi:hypothetical protein